MPIATKHLQMTEKVLSVDIPTPKLVFYLTNINLKSVSKVQLSLQHRKNGDIYTSPANWLRIERCRSRFVIFGNWTHPINSDEIPWISSFHNKRRFDCENRITTIVGELLIRSGKSFVIKSHFTHRYPSNIAEWNAITYLGMSHLALRTLYSSIITLIVTSRYFFVPSTHCWFNS